MGAVEEVAVEVVVEEEAGIVVWRELQVALEELVAMVELVAEEAG